MKKFFELIWSRLFIVPIFLIIALVVSMLYGCARVQYIPVETDTDSVVVERLVEVEIPPDSATIRALLECDEHGRIVLRWLDIANSKNAKAQLTIDSLGNLLAKMKTKSDTVYLPAKEVVVSKKEKVPYPVEKELTKWEQLRLDVGGWAMGGFIVVFLVFFVIIYYKLK